EKGDRELARSGPTGPLHGVPLTTKINTDQKGRATTNGVASFINLVAKEDSPSVANLRRAGAIVIGRTNAPEFSWRWFTDNELYGETINPWNRQRTCGGSSGGAAAAGAPRPFAPPPRRGFWGGAPPPPLFFGVFGDSPPRSPSS